MCADKRVFGATFYDPKSLFLSFWDERKAQKDRTKKDLRSEIEQKAELFEASSSQESNLFLLFLREFLENSKGKGEKNFFVASNKNTKHSEAEIQSKKHLRQKGFSRKSPLRRPDPLPNCFLSLSLPS
jgi:hypothetical protein